MSDDLPEIVTAQQVLDGRIGLISIIQFAELAQCSEGTIADWRARDKDFPKSRKGYLDLINTLRYVSRRVPSSKSEAIISRAAAILRKLESSGGKMPEDTVPKAIASRAGTKRDAESAKALETTAKTAEKSEKSPVSEPSPPPPPVAERNRAERNRERGKKGITHALERLRDAEQELGERFHEQLETEDPSAGVTFRLWKDAMDQLRKLEAEILEITRASGENIPAEDAKRAISLVCGAMKSRLLLLPTQIAHELADRDAPDIQEILQANVNSILDGLSKTV